MMNFNDLKIKEMDLRANSVADLYKAGISYALIKNVFDKSGSVRSNNNLSRKENKKYDKADWSKNFKKQGIDITEEQIEKVRDYLKEDKPKLLRMRGLSIQDFIAQEGERFSINLRGGTFDEVFEYEYLLFKCLESYDKERNQLK